MVILSRGKCGLSKCITRYLVAMAAADLMVVIVVALLDQTNMIHKYSRLLIITPICALTSVLRVATTGCSVWLTVAFTFDRFIAICCQQLQIRYCSERTATVVIVVVTILCCARCIPVYFAIEPYSIIDHVPWGCIFIAGYYTSSMWKAFELIDSILTPLLPIALILLFNGLTVRHIIAANRVRQSLRNNSENQKDPEVENRRKSMVLLFALSANFILLWMPYVVSSVNWQTQNYFYTDRYMSNPTYILQQLGFMFKFLSTCTNTCIYILSQRKFREDLKKGVKFVLTLNGHCCK
ncbi:probable G-protein coupled receptor 139 [Leucoraja erinacea]|uniref:probable G-protein coupled receptor 139 n=1 Tax=Leucoraja erinaceus TaxID=7782 RepID=UPI002456B4DB|nr:probable G-protein coupled receptor 139 [Leucoraja erinacea]